MSIQLAVPSLKDSSLSSFLRSLISRAIDGTRLPLFLDEVNQRVGIRTTAPAASAALEIGGTTGALLLPRLTTAQRDALAAVDGMVIYNSTVPQVQARVGGAWVAL